MSDWAKWLIVLFGIVVFGVVGMTALDKYDERSCRENPPMVLIRGSVYAPDPEDYVADRSGCDGFLPW